MAHEDTDGTHQQSDSQNHPVIHRHPNSLSNIQTRPVSTLQLPQQPLLSGMHPMRRDGVRHTATHHALVHSCTTDKKCLHYLHMSNMTSSVQWCPSIRLRKQRKQTSRTPHTYSRVSYGAKRHRWPRSTPSQPIHHSQQPTDTPKLIPEHTNHTHLHPQAPSTACTQREVTAYRTRQHTLPWFTAAPPPRSTLTTSTWPASLATLSGVPPSV